MKTRHRWVDNITLDLGEIGWGGMDWILERHDEVVWTGLVWLKTGISGGLLCMW
jgi:hypothetical protein